MLPCQDVNFCRTLGMIWISQILGVLVTKD